jgi:hypothetical protein
MAQSSASRPPSSRPPPRPATWSARRLSDVVIEVTFEGYLTADVLAASGAEYWRLAVDRPVPYAVIDAVAVTGFDRTIATEGWLASSRFRERGGLEYLMVSTSSALRMIGAALAASSHVPFRFFDTRAEAFAHLRALGAW